MTTRKGEAVKPLAERVRDARIIHRTAQVEYAERVRRSRLADEAAGFIEQGKGATG